MSWLGALLQRRPHVHRVRHRRRVGVFEDDVCRCGRVRMTWLDARGLPRWATTWTTGTDAVRQVQQRAEEPW